MVATGAAALTMVTSLSLVFRMVPNAADIPESAALIHVSLTVNGWEDREADWAVVVGVLLCPQPVRANEAAARMDTTGMILLFVMVMLSVKVVCCTGLNLLRNRWDGRLVA